MLIFSKWLFKYVCVNTMNRLCNRLKFSWSYVGTDGISCGFGLHQQLRRCCCNNWTMLAREAAVCRPNKGEMFPAGVRKCSASTSPIFGRILLIRKPGNRNDNPWIIGVRFFFSSSELLEQTRHSGSRVTSRERTAWHGLNHDGIVQLWVTSGVDWQMLRSAANG